jgi:hypothetical protein
MKKYLFVLSFFAILATVACDTSSKASTTQTAAPAPQAQTVAAPTALVVDTMAANMQMKKALSKKASKVQLLEMAPPQKTIGGAPTKN